MREGSARRKWWACAALLLAVALLGVGCSRVASDKQIANNIKARLFSDPQLRGNVLAVSVKNGVATLSGSVPSVSARYEAFKVTADTPGVKQVNDEMNVEEPVPTTQAFAATPPSPAPEAKPKPREIRHRRRAIRQAGPANQNESASSETPAAAPGPEAESVPAPSEVGTNEAANMAQPAPPPAVRITIPQGTKISVRMIDSVNSELNHTGDILHASLARPIKVDGKVVAPVGTDVYLQLVEVNSAGHFGGRSELRLELYRIVIQGTSYPIVSNDYVDKGASRTKRSLLTILGGSAIGAAIGAIAGGGKGAAIGAAAGGGGGAVYQGVTNGKQVNIAPETLLKFKLEQPADVTINPNAPQTNSDSQPTLQPEPGSQP